MVEVIYLRSYILIYFIDGRDFYWTICSKWLLFIYSTHIFINVKKAQVINLIQLIQLIHIYNNKKYVTMNNKKIRECTINNYLSRKRRLDKWER